jgi:hypothetical protein
MDNFSDEQIRSKVIAPFYDLYVTNHGADINLDRFRELIMEHYSSMGEELKGAINGMDLGWFRSMELTVEVTTKKKGRVVFAAWPHQHMKGKVLEIAENIRKDVPQATHSLQPVRGRQGSSHVPEKLQAQKFLLQCATVPVFLQRTCRSEQPKDFCESQAGRRNSSCLTFRRHLRPGKLSVLQSTISRRPKDWPQSSQSRIMNIHDIDKSNLPKGTELQMGDWDTGWMSTATVLGSTPKNRFYRVQVHGAAKPSLLSKRDVSRGYYSSFDGYPWPIKVKKMGPVCCKCGKEAEADLHSCPYEEDIHDDHTPHCNCCSECSHECMQEI